MLKQESKCPAGVWAVLRGSHRAQKVSLPLSMDLVQSFPAAGQKSPGSSGKGESSRAVLDKEKQEAAGWEILSRAEQAGVVLTLCHWVLHRLVQIHPLFLGKRHLQLPFPSSENLGFKFFLTVPRKKMKC